MILVDTSVWIDHLHSSERRLVDLLSADEVGCHPQVIEELALGSIKERTRVLGLLSRLRRFPILTHTEVLDLVESQRMWGHGLSAVDAHLLGATMLVPAAQLWTRDKRLRAACSRAGVKTVKE